jgi:hypothetical protein
VIIFWWVIPGQRIGNFFTWNLKDFDENVPLNFITYESQSKKQNIHSRKSV